MLLLAFILIWYFNQLQLMKLKFFNISFIAEWTKLFSIGLFLVFFHCAILVPVLEYHQIDVSIVETMNDKESENEGEEIEDELDQEIQSLLTPLTPQKRLILIGTTDAKHELHHVMFSPPPEQV